MGVNESGAAFGGGVDCLAYGAHYTTSAAGMPNAIWTEAFSYSRHTVSGDSWYVVCISQRRDVLLKPALLPEEKTTPQGWTERGTIKAVLDDPSVGSLDRRGKSLPLY
jgi:hypothetical protein